MSRMAPFSSPLMLGFDEIEQLVERIGKSQSDGYPPYNIERIATDSHLMLRITLAVAGFSENDLEITVEARQLHIRGRQGEEDNREYLHRGIAMRQFHRAFVLADGMDIAGADLKDGILGIDLVRHTPEPTAKRIDISTQGRDAVTDRRRPT